MKRYHPNTNRRKSIRLKGYDYSQPGLYFITICCQNRICRFGHVENGGMVLNEYGMVAYNEWEKLPERFPNFNLDVFQIMPNHIHGIIALSTVGAGFTPAEIDGGNFHIDGIIQNNGRTDNNGQPQGVAPTVSDIVGAYKSLVANGCLTIYKSRNETMGKLWQPNYYEHIIRNGSSYQRIAKYIIDNPAKWQDDKFHRP